MPDEMTRNIAKQVLWYNQEIINLKNYNSQSWIQVERNDRLSLLL